MKNRREKAIKNIVISIFIMILSIDVLVWTKIFPDLWLGKNVMQNMEFIEFISYFCLGILSCVAFLFGHLAEKQISFDNSCNEKSYIRFKKYIRYMMYTFEIMILGVVVLAIYILVIR